MVHTRKLILNNLEMIDAKLVQFFASFPVFQFYVLTINLRRAFHLNNQRQYKQVYQSFVTKIYLKLASIFFYNGSYFM